MAIGSDARSTFLAVVKGDASQAVTEFKKLGDSVQKSTTKADTSVGKFRTMANGAMAEVKANAGLLAAGGAVAFAAYGKRVLELGTQFEALDAKAETVFAGSLASVQEWARANAGAMGETETAAIAAAASIADLLKPMGFTAEAAAEQSMKMMDLAGALSAWTGGQKSAAEVAQTLTKAMLGEREELKSLGISITEADVQARLAAKGQKQLTGAALAQAKAIATQEMIIEKSTDAQKAWADGSMDGVKKSNEMNAAMAQLEETIVRELYPAIVEMTPAIKDLAESINDFVGPAAKVVSVGTKMGGSIKFAADQWSKFRDIYGGDLNGMIDRATAAIDAQADRVEYYASRVEAAGDETVATADHIEYYRSRVDAAEQVTRDLADAEKRAYDRTRDLRQAMQDLNDIQLDGIAAKLDAVTAFNNLVIAQRDYNDAVKEGTASTEELAIQANDLAVQAADLHKAQQEAAGGTQTAAERTMILVAQYNQLQSTLKVGSPLWKAIEAYKQQLFSIPSNINTKVMVNGKVVQDNTSGKQGAGSLTIGTAASGTKSARAGTYLVGEQGPELVTMRGGERVYPTGQTLAMIGAGSRGGGQTVTNVTANIYTSADPNAVVAALKQWQRNNGPLPVKTTG